MHRKSRYLKIMLKAQRRDFSDDVKIHNICTNKCWAVDMDTVVRFTLNLNMYLTYILKKLDFFFPIMKNEI